MEARILILPVHLQWTKAYLCCMHNYLSSTHQGCAFCMKPTFSEAKDASLAGPAARAADLRVGTCCKQAVLAVVPSCMGHAT